MYVIKLLKKEHAQIRGILSEMESLIGTDNQFYVASLLDKLKQVWDRHEFREERIFQVSKSKGMPFPEETMLLEQHRELKGHWKVLREMFSRGNKQKIGVALDTDGRMMIEKFRRHMGAEDDFFDVLLEQPMTR